MSAKDDVVRVARVPGLKIVGRKNGHRYDEGGEGKGVERDGSLSTSEAVLGTSWHLRDKGG